MPSIDTAGSGSGTTVIGTDADFFISGSDTGDTGDGGPVEMQAVNRTINNFGRAYWDSGDISFLGNVALNNSGEFNALNGNTLAGQNAGNVFNNYGTFLRSGNDGSGDTQITGMPFNNIPVGSPGGVQIQMGNLTLQTGISTGPWTITGGASLSLSNGTYSFNSGSSFAYQALVNPNVPNNAVNPNNTADTTPLPGKVIISYATMTVNADVTVNSLDLQQPANDISPAQEAAEGVLVCLL